MGRGPGFGPAEPFTGWPGRPSLLAADDSRSVRVGPGVAAPVPRDAARSTPKLFEWSSGERLIAIRQLCAPRGPSEHLVRRATAARWPLRPARASPATTRRANPVWTATPGAGRVHPAVVRRDRGRQRGVLLVPFDAPSERAPRLYLNAASTYEGRMNPRDLLLDGLSDRRVRRRPGDHALPQPDAAVLRAVSGLGAAAGRDEAGADGADRDRRARSDDALRPHPGPVPGVLTVRR